MRIDTLELEAFRKFDRRMRLEGLGAGLNVLCEPNEFGKSTLLAAIKAVIFERHRSRADSVRQMKHARHDLAPLVSIGFHLNGALHHVEKRFLHREPYARLTLPDGTRLEGDVAEERLQALLGFAAAGKQGANADSIGLWGALWCAQQAAGEQPVLPQLGRATLHACLEAELGTLAGDDRSSAVRIQVEAELGQLLDGRGNPKGRYKEAADELQQTSSHLEQLNRKRAWLEDAIDKLARLRRELAQANDAGAKAKLTQDLVAARTLRDTVRQHADRLQQAKTDLELATQRYADAKAETKRRLERAQQIVLADQAVADFKASEALATAALTEAKTALTSRRAAVQAAEVNAAATVKALRHANALAALVSRSAQTRRLRDHLARAETAQAEVNRLFGALMAQPADEIRLDAARAASLALVRASSMLDAQATEITFDIIPGSAGVQADGLSIPPGRTILRATTETVLHLPGIGQIQIRPVIQNHTTLQGAVSSATAKLQAALAVIGATDLDAAETLAAARRGIEAELRHAEAALAAAAIGDAAADSASGLEPLRNLVAAEESRMAAELATLHLAALPSEAVTIEAAHVAELAEAAANEALATARAAMIAPQTDHERANTARMTATARVTEARNNRQRLDREATAALAQESADALAERLRMATSSQVARHAIVVQLQQEAPSESVDLLDARIRRYDEAAQQDQRKVANLREDIARLDAGVARDEGEGLSEAIALAKRKHEDLTLEHTSLTREAAILTLLRSTLLEAEREARARYRAPVMRRMTPYLQSLFPDVEVTLDDDLRVTSLTRRAEHELLAMLSDGTREQIAVLLRLAYADLLRERGRPAMLILDDALAYSDPERRELMFDLLTNASANMQILILTCRADAISRLGGNRVTLVPV